MFQCVWTDLRLKKLFRGIISEHEQDFDPDSTPKDFIESYLKGMASNKSMTKEDLIGICMDFFEAGGETVSTTLSWFFLYMSLNPECQEKCYTEISEVLGEY
jgi:cytochrome P450